MNNIWIAASDNKIDLVKEYIEKGQSANSADINGYTPIHAAASYGHTDLLLYLIKQANGDINIKDTDGDTPLHSVETAKMARILVEELGADPKIKNDEGQTPLQKIEEDDEFPEIIEYLRSLEHRSSGETTETALAVLPENASVRYSYQNEDTAMDNEEVDPERRKRLEEIMTTNPEEREENLRVFVQEIIHGRLEESDDPKRHRND